MGEKKLTVAVHKLTSCSGCQLAFLNQGEALLPLLDVIRFTHFIEAGLESPDENVDIIFVEGSVSTPEDLTRLKRIREKCRWLISIGACATSGGIQALRNLTDGDAWKQAVYAHPEFIQTLSTSTGVAEHVHVDFELWGCPVTPQQVTHLIQQLRSGALPESNAEKLCMECKRKQQVCVMVTRGSPCMGPAVRAGCGALCPEFGKACYGCFGPSEQPNCESLSRRFVGLGLPPRDIVNRFAAIHSHSEPFKHQIEHWKAIDIRELE